MAKSHQLFLQKAPFQTFDWVLNTSLHPSFQELYIYFCRGRFRKGKNGRMKEWIFTKVWFDFAKQTIVFTKKSLYIIFLNKKVKWLKFLLANKGPPYLFEKFNWKFRINIWVEVIQSICEFVKSVNQ